MRRSCAAAAVWIAVGVLLALYLVGTGLSYVERVRDPSESLYGESIVLDEAHRVPLGQPLYAAPTGLPLTVTAYMPVYYLLVGWLQAGVDHPGYAVGRLVSVAATIGCAALIAVSVFRATQCTGKANLRWLAGTLAAALFLTQNLTVLLWGPTYRVDMLALCFALAGLALATSGRTTLAALPLVLSVLTKQTYLAAPLCVFVTLWPNRRSMLVFASLFVGALGVALGVGTWLTHNLLLWHTFVADANPLEFDYFSSMLGSFAQFNALPLVAAGALFGLSSLPAERLWRMYFVVSGLVALATVGKLGASSNYWLELTAATSVLIGVLAVRLASATHRAPFTSAGLAGLLLASLLTCVPAYQLTVSQAATALLNGPPQATTQRLQAAAYVANEPGALLTDDPNLAVLAGKRVEFEAIVFTLLAAQGTWDEAPILDAIQARQFGLVALTESLDAPQEPLIARRLSDNVRAVLRQAYAPAGQLEGYWLYRPA
ncbi:MAG: hypothetical protein JO057_21110 [Chloroflexi bacterium]|nr:hypothetical protein [Chloroflexota bacterium]